jgi:hypothetical protein
MRRYVYRSGGRSIVKAAIGALVSGRSPWNLIVGLGERVDAEREQWAVRVERLRHSELDAMRLANASNCRWSSLLACSLRCPHGSSVGMSRMPSGMRATAGRFRPRNASVGAAPYPRATGSFGRPRVATTNLEPVDLCHIRACCGV